MQVKSRLRTRALDLKTKTRPATQTLKRDVVIRSRHCMIETVKKQPFEDVFQNFTIFTGKHMCWSLFLINLLAWTLFFLKKTPTKMLPVDIVKFLRTGFFYRTPPVAASDSPTTVHAQCVCVLWFRVSLWFSFWSKTYPKRYTNNSLLSHDKIIFSLIERVLSISEYVSQKY